MEPAQAKAALFEEFARLGAALSSAQRLQMLDVLCQGERDVDSIARASGLKLTNASQHLQALRSAGLVSVRAEGTRRLYRVASGTVCDLLHHVQAVARERLAEADRIAREYFEDVDAFEPVDREGLASMIASGSVLVIDVRPEEEYGAGHIPGAVSVPMEHLLDRVSELPKTARIVAYCRGPYCVLATEAVRVLRERGFDAERIREGMPGWIRGGDPVSVGEEV